jgi:SAM-dependent methyltransferase
MRDVYRRLILEWLDTANEKIRLKTDLFEEAVSSFNPLSDLGEGSLGFDVSLNVVQSAHAALPQDKAFKLLVADLRKIPLEPRSVGGILSGSSLDHFSTVSDLHQGLSELERILAPGGILVLTLDNLHNPLIWIRDHLPFPILNKLGIVPYYFGKTLRREEVRQKLNSLGFDVSYMTAVAHAPRAPAIWTVRIAERFGWRHDWLLKFLPQFEALENWPTRYLTGYYLALRAVKTDTTNS